MRYHAARLHLHTLPLPTDEVNFRAQLVALLWPPPAPEPVIHRCGQLQLNPDEFSVLCRGVQVYPTRREFELLLTLIRQPGHVFSTLELHALLWRGEQVGLNVVRQTVRRIRKRLLPEIIETTPGGYQLRRCS